MYVEDVSRIESSASVGWHLPRRILVAFDGSPGAWAALHRAIAIAVTEHSRLTVVTAVADPSVWLALAPYVIPYSRERLRRESEIEAERLLAAARDEVPATVSVTTRLIHGRPARALVREARSGDYDLVVTGPRDDRRIARSVTRTLLARCPVSVLAVREA